MSKAKSSDPAVSQPFVLKHRIAGAAFLFFFGALVLPWLLGPPSEASRDSTTVNRVQSAEEVSVQNIEDELLAAIDDEMVIEEEVYISKITPLDSQNEALETKPSVAASSKPEAKEPKADSSSEKSEKTGATTNAAALKLAEQRKAAEENDKKAKERAAKKRQEEAQVAKAQKEAQEKKTRAANEAKLAAESTRQNKIESDLASALAAESASIQAQKTVKPNTKKVDYGWVVQVGLFENKQGAERVVKDLKAKGFTPSVTVVDTNRGKATGTRVWLGPYAQRVDAAKAMTRLSERTGQSGFIRAYP